VKTKTTFIAATLLALGVAFAQAPAPTDPAVAAEKIIYDKALADGWQNWSWAKTTLSTELGGSAQRDPGTEAEAGQPQGLVRMGGTRPGGHRAQVVQFASALVEGAIGLADPAEVEAQGGDAGFAQRARGHGHHLVVHAAALGGQRMADDGQHGLRHAARLGQVERGLDAARGPGDGQWLVGAGGRGYGFAHVAMMPQER